jgi:putative ATP-binding cassette transporter
VPLIPVLIVAPRYLRGQIEFGVVTQSAMAFAQVLDATSLIVVQFQSLSEFAAVVARLGGLWEVLERAAMPGQAGIQTVEDDERVAYEQLTLRTPRERRLLVQQLSVQVLRGERLLIAGPNGAGKSALFRATAGICAEGEGRVIRPHRDLILFLPQQPVVVRGSLRHQLLYGLHRRGVTDDRLQGALRAVQFASVLERAGGLDAEQDWATLTSTGEQQLLAFARLLLANPPFAFIDNAINALDPARGAQAYQALARSTITYLSVGDHARLNEYHDRVLEICNDGSWQLRPARSAVA